MNKRYRLGDIEEAVSEMEELIDIEDDIAEIDDDFQIVVSGWSVYVESLNLTLNRVLRDADGDIYDIVAGRFFIVGLGESDFTDLPHELAEQFAERFRQPEMFMRVDGKIVAAPMPDEQAQGGKTGGYLAADRVGGVQHPSEGRLYRF